MQKFCIGYFIGVVVGCLIGFRLADKKCDTTIREIETVAYEVYEQRLADPHHCVSVCEKEFAKYGC